MTDNFKQFLTSLEDYDKPLIESIRNGFSVIYEASNTHQFTDRYNSSDNTYELISESPEYIIELIKQSPTMISAIQQNNIQPETITKLELYVDDITGEGSGYYGGSKGSWDEPGEDSMFEDGIEVTMSNIMANIYTSTGEAVEELEIEESTDPEITSTIKEKIEQDDSLYEQLLNEYETNISYNKAEARASRFESYNGKYNEYNYPTFRGDSIIPDAIAVISKYKHAIKFTNKPEFMNFAKQQKYFSLSMSHCFYSKEELNQFRKTSKVVNPECEMGFNTGRKLVMVWDDKNQIGYIIPSSI